MASIAVSKSGGTSVIKIKIPQKVALVKLSSTYEQEGFTNISTCVNLVLMSVFSGDIVIPVVGFDLDAADSPAEPLYTSIAKSALLFAGVAQSMGVDLTREDRNDWSVLHAAAYAIDGIVDEQRQDLDQRIAVFLDGGHLEGASEQVSSALRGYVEKQPGERQAAVKRRIGMIGLYVARCTEAQTVDQLIAARNAEAGLFADFLSLPPSGNNDGEQRRTFNNWLHAFSRAGYLIDSLADLRPDYESGEVSVKPTIRNHAVLAKAALKESVNLSRLTPLKSLLHVFQVGYNYQVAGRKLRQTSII